MNIGRCWVRGRLPRKQGLKLGIRMPVDIYPDVRGRLPRKQGLKHSDTAAIKYKVAVRGRLPRKQGLKQMLSGYFSPLIHLSEGDFHENKD